MQYYVLEPEVAGGTGSGTIFIDMQARPPLLEKFHYEFDGWLGDPILENVCNYIVTKSLEDTLRAMQATGVSFSEVEISTSEEYREWDEIEPKGPLPAFSWLQITGEAGKDDFGYTSVHSVCMVVSERVLDLFLEAGMKHGQLVELEGWKGSYESDYRQQK